MHGNVMEWTLDRRYDNAATRKTLRGAINASSSDSRYVLHGGCYNRAAYQAVRSHINTEWRNNRYDVIGFRVVVNLP
jgi:formylglycine-generating enzyme required for sulfatase activity